MRILYIAPARDFSGYANAARGYIRALHLAGADIVVRPVRYDRADVGSEYVPTAVERELLRKPLTDIDVVIQHVTPNEMRPVAGKTNIAVVAWETTLIPEYWARKLNKFDSVITFCDASVKAFRDSGVTVPIFKIPHTFDISTYTLDGVDPIDSPNTPEFFKDRFVFYNISQLSAKKGIDVLLRAYYAQFHGSAKDSVMLVLKTYVDMSNRQAEQARLQQYVQNVKAAMRLPPDSYPPVMVVTNTLTDHQIKKLHATGDAYVCSSRAEGWCIPAFEALAYGKKLVTTTWGGMGEFALNPDPDGEPNIVTGACFVGSSACRPNVFPVDYSMEPLIGQGHSDPDLYTARELIAEPSVSSMMAAMQHAVDDEQETKADLSEFDYGVVGPLMLDVIKQTSKIEEEANV